ncbi:MAG: desulfoferrodoxin [bacterium]
MPKFLQIYKCDMCGNMTEVIHEGWGELVCCGKPMKLFLENIVEAAYEKHIPVIKRLAYSIKINIGNTPHPMEEKHYIEWIEVVADGRSYRQVLKPTDIPEVNFNLKAEHITARAFCNLHGLWKN